MDAQGAASGSSPQGQMTTSNDKELIMIGSDNGSSPSQRFSEQGQRRDCDHSSANSAPDFESMSPEAQAAISRVSFGRPTATLTPVKSKRKRDTVPQRLLKELASFNKDSGIDTENSIPGLNPREAHNTRTFVRSLNIIATGSNAPMPPRENLNWKRLEDEQLKPRKKNARSTSDVGSHESEEDHEKSQGKFTTNARSPRKVSGVRSEKEAAIEEAKRQRRLKTEGKNAWKLWRARKENISNLIKDPGSADMDSLNGSMVLDNFNMSMQDGSYVFAPTAGELWNFQNFITKVEDVIGRKRGFVKIVIPNSMKSNYCPPHPIEYASSAAESSSDGSSFSFRPYKTKLDLHKPFESKSNTVIYHVRMLGGVNVRISEWQEAMQQYQKGIMRRLCESPFHTRDVDEEVRCTPRNEKELIADSESTSDDMYYTADVQESHSLRQVLRLGGPYLRAIRGKLNSEGRYASSHDISSPRTSLVGDRLKEPGKKALVSDRSQIQLAGAKGSPFGLEMTANAAFSLNYLHRGAPKRWIIIEPDAHQRLEELLYPQVEFTAGRLVKNLRSGYKPPTHPPRCDQFLYHQPLYVPKETLAIHSIPYTEIVQYEGEMVVTFPFAYYQGFSSGPNLAEAISFGNERWETIQQSRLYQPCHANCSGPADPGQAKRSENDEDSPGHASGHDIESVLEEEEEDDSDFLSDPDDGSFLSDPEDGS